MERLGEGRGSWHEASDPQRYPSPAISPRESSESNPLRHHQQSRTIFRCVSSKSQQKSPSRSSHPLVTDDSNGGAACSTSPGGNNGEGRAVPTWPEQNTQGGATSPQPPGVMNAAEESGSKSNVQVWKLDANTEQDSNDPGCHQQQALQSFTLQETLFVEQLAAIDERVRNQVCVCVFEITFFCRRSILTRAYVRSQ